MSMSDAPVSWREVADERGLPSRRRRPGSPTTVSRPSEDPLPPMVQSGKAARSQQHHIAALAAAGGATDAAEFGRALRMLLEKSNFTQSDVLRHHANRAQLLKKSTLSRMVNGTTLCRRAEHVKAFVAACGADADIPAWVDAWRDVRRRVSATNMPVAKPIALNVPVAAMDLHIRITAVGDVVVGLHATTDRCVVCTSESSQ